MFLNEWNKEITGAIEGEKETLIKALEIFANRVSEELIQNSAVQTGRYKANWHFSVNGQLPPAMPFEFDPLGYRTLQKARDNAAALLPRGAGIYSLTWSNALTYAYALEYGSSTQMPSGNIRVVEANVQRLWEEAYRESQNH